VDGAGGALGTELDAAAPSSTSLLGSRVHADRGSLGLEDAVLPTRDPASPWRSSTSGSRGPRAGGHGRVRIYATRPITAGGRELRSFGSQGEQRTAVLALVLAEAELLAERRGEPPLFSLDDVFSELDTERRGASRPASGRRTDGDHRNAQPAGWPSRT
jgi:hypothetical protein